MICLNFMLETYKDKSMNKPTEEKNNKLITVLDAEFLLPLDLQVDHYKAFHQVISVDPNHLAFE